MSAPSAVPPCGARATFWPDEEGCEASCWRPAGHRPADVHEDETLGEWTEDELITSEPTGETPP